MTASLYPAAARLRRFARFAATAAVVAGFGAGVPWLLWWGAGGRLLPAPGVGGWPEVWAQLRSGLLPDPAVLTAAVVLGWLIWAYLVAVFLSELRIAWRDRNLELDRAGEVTGVRRMMARASGWLLAGHTTAASLLVGPPAALFNPPPATVVAVDASPAAAAPDGATPAETPRPVFDPHGYVNFPVDTPAPAAPEAAGFVEREIVPGDNLWTIAETLTGDGFNYQAIWAATDLAAQDPPVDAANPDLIFPGNVVRIPADLITTPQPGPPTVTPADAPTPAPDPALPAEPAEPTTSAVPGEPVVPAESAPPEVEEPPVAASAGGSAPGEVGEPTAPAADVAAAGSGPGSDGGIVPGEGGERGLGPVDGFALAGSPTLVAALGLGGAGGAVLLAGVARRRKRAMAASHRGQRPPRRDRRAATTSQRLLADLPAGSWAPEDLVAGWNSLLPADPGARQPWCVRWNSPLRVLECAWTDDPSVPDGDGPGDPPEPGPGSPWKLVTKQDRSGEPVSVWTLAEADIPAAPARRVVPAMVGCANGRRDRPSSDGFYINLEAAGVIAVESSNPELMEPEGVVRALLLQLQANSGVEVHLLDTDLGFDEVDREIHLDPMALEAQLVADLTANQDLWESAESVFALRSAGVYDGPTIVVVGPSEQLRHCSHLLSLARAGTVPLTVISLGPLAMAWATFLLEPEPDKHAIRFPASRAVLTFDHLSWVSTTDAADLVHLIAASARPWIDRAPATPVDTFDDDDLDSDGLLPYPSPRPAAPTGTLLIDQIDDLFDPDTAHGPADSGLTGRGQPWGGNGGAWASSDADDGSDGDLEAARMAELWDSLAEADPDSLDGRPYDPADAESGRPGDDAGDADDPDDLAWAIGADDDVIDGILGASLDDLVNSDASHDLGSDPVTRTGPVREPATLFDPAPVDPSDSDDDDGDLVLVDAPSPSVAAAGELPATARGGAWSAAAADRARSVSSTLRLDTRAGAGPDPDAEPDADELDDTVGGVVTDTSGLLSVGQASGSSGLRLEVCGPIRLLRRSPCGAGFVEVPLGGGSGLTGARLSLLAYLAVVARPGGGGVDREQIAGEFWPEVHADGTLRQVRADTVKRRVWDLRKVLAEVAGIDDGRELLVGADGRYAVGDIVCDWRELGRELVVAESQESGSPRWQASVEAIERIVRPPTLLTAPNGVRVKSQFTWLVHYEDRLQDMTRRVVCVLTDHGRYLTGAGRCREALQLLAVAREVATSYTREVADATVAAYLALGDPVQAERECTAYESQYGEELSARGREAAFPGSPRARLDAYVNRRS